MEANKDIMSAKGGLDVWRMVFGEIDYEEEEEDAKEGNEEEGHIVNKANEFRVTFAPQDEDGFSCKPEGGEANSNSVLLPMSCAESEQKQRNMYYSLADEGYMRDVDDFCTEQKKKVEAFGAKEWVTYLQEWMKWLDKYLMTKSTDNMPKSWSSSNPLPIAYVINEGDAGTGKTFCNNTHLRQRVDGTVSSGAGKGTDAYLDYASRDTIPGGMAHVVRENTMCKMFRIRFSRADIAARMESAKTDKELEDSYESLSNDMRCLYDAAYRTDRTRKHFALAARVLWPLVSECYNVFMDEYVKHELYKIRRTVSEDKRFTPTAVASADLRLSLKAQKEKEKKKEKKNAGDAGNDELLEGRMGSEKDVRLVDLCTTQDSWRMAVQLTERSKTGHAPACVLFPLLVFEEDGMAASFYADLRQLLVMMMLYVYQPPYMYKCVPIIQSSGSKTQSSSIGSRVSCLEHCSGPAFLGDRENVLPYTADFFRRTVTSLEAPHMAAYRATCLALERNLPTDESTFSSLFTHELHDSELDNPEFFPNGTRLYSTHRDVRSFTDAYTSSRCEQVCLTDVVYVCDLLVPMSVVLNINEEGPTPSKKGLSCLTGKKAAQNRRYMWWSKRHLYSSYRGLHPRQVPPNILPWEEDFKCDATKEEPLSTWRHKLIEEEMMKRKAKPKTKQMSKDSVQVGDEVTDEEDFVESTVTGFELPGMSGLPEGAQEDVAFDTLEEGAGTRDRRKMRKRKKDGKITDVIDVTTGEAGTLSSSPKERQTEKDGVMFIVGKATNLLSRSEHEAKRMYATSIADTLGNGQQLASNCLNGSKVVDHVSPMDHSGASDMVLEFARPTYLSKGEGTDEMVMQGLPESVSARLLYMPFKRVRKLHVGSPVTDEDKSKMSLVSFRGVQCSLLELSSNMVFSSHAPTCFRCMIFERVLDTLKMKLVKKHQGETIEGVHDLLTPATQTLLENGDKYVMDLLAVAMKGSGRRGQQCTVMELDAEEAERLIDGRDGDGEEETASEQRKQRKKNLTEALSRCCGKLERLVYSLRGMAEHTEFVQEELTLSSDTSPLYPFLRYFENSVTLSSMGLIHFGDVRLVGDWTHPCNSVWLEMAENQYHQDMRQDGVPHRLLQQEAYLTTYRQVNISACKALWMGVETYDFPLWREMVSTLLVQGSILMTTVPFCTRNVRWGKVFGREEPRRNWGRGDGQDGGKEGFGLMLRRNMPGGSTKLLVNGMFSCAGELMNLPRPFRSGKHKALSDVILKTQDGIIPYCNSGILEGLGMLRDDKDKKVRRVEFLVMFTAMSPLYGGPAFTVAYVQGSTHTTEVLANLSKVKHTDQLVAMTRLRDVDLMKVSSLDTGALKQWRASHTDENEWKRMKRAETSGFYMYRQ